MTSSQPWRCNGRHNYYFYGRTWRRRCDIYSASGGHDPLYTRIMQYGTRAHNSKLTKGKSRRRRRWCMWIRSCWVMFIVLINVLSKFRIKSKPHSRLKFNGICRVQNKILLNISGSAFKPYWIEQVQIEVLCIGKFKFKSCWFYQVQITSCDQLWHIQVVSFKSYCIHQVYVLLPSNSRRQVYTVCMNVCLLVSHLWLSRRIFWGDFRFETSGTSVWG